MADTIIIWYFEMSTEIVFNTDLYTVCTGGNTVSSASWLVGSEMDSQYLKANIGLDSNNNPVLKNPI